MIVKRSPHSQNLSSIPSRYHEQVTPCALSWESDEACYASWSTIFLRSTFQGQRSMAWGREELDVCLWSGLHGTGIKLLAKRANHRKQRAELECQDWCLDRKVMLKTRICRHRWGSLWTGPRGLSENLYSEAQRLSSTRRILPWSWSGSRSGPSTCD